MNGITAAYAGVHQIFQIALASFEIGKLDRFFCSICDGSGKLGSFISAIGAKEALVNRRCDAIAPQLIEEFPWPFILHRVCKEITRNEKLVDWSRANHWFDSHVSMRLRDLDSKLFVGVETCASESFKIAKQKGMATILDCPQVHPAFLNDILQHAAADLKIASPPPFDSPEISRRKQEEFELADFILVLSDVHRRSFIEQGFNPERLVEIALWADPALWFPPPERPMGSKKPLKVIFIGQIGLRKGIPYLLMAMAQAKHQIDLTLVGPITDDITQLLAQYRDHYKIRSPQHKSELRNLLWNSDLLVLPSVVDTFGFAAMEAMACGVPVVVTENCGVPVPDPSWRVPAMDSAALTRRIAEYAEDPDLRRINGERAREFVAQFTPQRYRKELQKFLLGLLTA